MKDIPNYEGIYAATEDGQIWSHRRQKFLTPCGGEGNYQIVMFSVKGKTSTPYVHRLVAMAWLPNPDNLPEINHKNRCRDDNRVENLEWCDRVHNLAHIGRKTVPVYCVELDKTYHSVYSAAKEMNSGARNLLNCVRGKQKTYAGYHWRLAE